MKYLWILLLFAGCSPGYIEYTFEAFTDNKSVENIVIRHENGVAVVGTLHLRILPENMSI